MTKTLSAIAITVALALTGITASIFNTPCATEDSTHCYWNGDTRGNGSGTSFIAVTDTISIRTK